MIGFATAIFGVIAGSVAAWLIVSRLMTLSPSGRPAAPPLWWRRR